MLLNSVDQEPSWRQISGVKRLVSRSFPIILFGCLDFGAKRGYFNESETISFFIFDQEIRPTRRMWAIRMNFQRLTKPAECSVNYQLRKSSLILHIRPALKRAIISVRSSFPGISGYHFIHQRTIHCKWLASGES